MVLVETREWENRKSSGVGPVPAGDKGASRASRWG